MIYYKKKFCSILTASCLINPDNELAFSEDEFAVKKGKFDDKKHDFDLNDDIKDENI